MSRKHKGGVAAPEYDSPNERESRGPLLIDRFARRVSEDGDLAKFSQGYQRAATLAQIRQARVFVLDNDAVDRFASVVRDIPEYIAKHQEFARAPYENIWVEFDFIRFWESATGRSADATADSRLAYWVVDGNARVISGGNRLDPTSRPAPVPVVFRLHTPWEKESREQFLKDCDTTDIQVLAWMWGEATRHFFPTREIPGSYGDGYAYVKEGESVEHETAIMLRDAHTPHLLGLRHEDLITEREVFEMLVNGASGDLRNVIALLLLLNRPSLITFVQDVPRRRGFIGNKVVPYFAHTVATISLDPKPAIIKIGTVEDEHTTKRRHEVRGHYCHNQTYKEATARGCEHDMQRDDDATHPEDSWKCRICTGKRWWKPKFERGDAGKGFVIKQYNVTAGNNEGK